jgi:hypothetical protein
MGAQSLSEMPSEDVGTGIPDKIKGDHIIVTDKRHIPDILLHGGLAPLPNRIEIQNYGIRAPACQSTFQ